MSWATVHIPIPRKAFHAQLSANGTGLELRPSVCHGSSRPVLPSACRQILSSHRISPNQRWPLFSAADAFGKRDALHRIAPPSVLQANRHAAESTQVSRAEPGNVPCPAPRPADDRFIPSIYCFLTRAMRGPLQLAPWLGVRHLTLGLEMGCIKIIYVHNASSTYLLSTSWMLCLCRVLSHLVR